MSSGFIEFPNGELLKKQTIMAIRLGEPRSKGEMPFDFELKPRVIVDFMIGEHGNCLVIDCETIDERNQLAENIKNQLQ